MVRKRQAVVLIHGIGEQRPMDTLRSFVSGLGFKTYHSRPDRLSDSLELRRYTIPGTTRRPVTDCYELYWSHHFGRGKLLPTLGWAVRLLCRPRLWYHQGSLRNTIFAVLACGLVTAVFLGWLASLAMGRLTSTDIAGFVWVGIALLVLLVTAIFCSFITGRVAQAARYLVPHPANLPGRNAIRADGLKLLRRLHEDDRYERIILVGHSLGSVIGLDLLRLAWDELRQANPPKEFAQPEAEAMDRFIAQLPTMSGDLDIAAFQQAQYRLWKENRHVGVEWRISDFVTLGSPLTHASLLLDTRKVKLQQRMEEGEYPCCPPLPDPETIFLNKLCTSTNGEQRSVKVGMTHAPFGPTRWTNLYFPVRFALLGDPVGGPVASEFGPGVRDVPVRPSVSEARSRRYQMLMKSHSKYWVVEPGYPSSDRAVRKAQDQKTRTKDAHTMLLDAFAL